MNGLVRLLTLLVFATAAGGGAIFLAGYLTEPPSSEDTARAAAPAAHRIEQVASDPLPPAPPSLRLVTPQQPFAQQFPLDPSALLGNNSQGSNPGGSQG